MGAFRELDLQVSVSENLDAGQTKELRRHLWVISELD